MRRSCNELWRIVEKGFHPQHDSDNYSTAETIDAQLNDTALHMIQQAVHEKDFPFIMKHTIAKDAWDGLADLYIGNESMRHNKYSALKNQAEGFMKNQNEDHQDMYARLITIAAAFRNVGATHIDDKWIKEKYVEALWPHEPQDLKTLQGRHNYYQMTSHELMQELQSFKVAEKNANDALKRAMGIAKGENLALKATVVAEVKSQEIPPHINCPEEMKHEWSEHMAFAARTFWRDPAKAKEQNYQRNNSSNFKSTGGARTCYNCGERFHFVAECPYEPREDHGGRLIPKNKGKDVKETRETKAPHKKPFIKKKKNFRSKKSGRVVLIAEEEYDTSQTYL